MATAQMARHCGHHKNRLPLRILMSTSTGEQWHSGQGTATNSGLSNQAFPWLPKERPARRGGNPSRSRGTHTVPWSQTQPRRGDAAPQPWAEHQQCQRLGCAETGKDGNRSDHGSAQRCPSVCRRRDFREWLVAAEAIGGGQGRSLARTSKRPQSAVIFVRTDLGLWTGLRGGRGGLFSGEAGGRPVPGAPRRRPC